MAEKLLRVEIEEAGYPEGFHLRNISFDLDPGEILLVTGRSGSGKTTLLKTIMQTIGLDGGYYKGRITLHGENIEDIPPQRIYREIAYIPQEPWYGIIGYTVWLEYCIGLNQSGKRCTLEHLRKYGLETIAKRTTYNLSAGEYQRLLWATTLDRDPGLLVIDEPFVYIDEEGRDTIYRMIEEYLENDGAIIVVDHEPSRWRRVKPKTLLLEDGIVKYYGGYREDIIHIEGISRVKINGLRKGRILIDMEGVEHRYPYSKKILKKIDMRVFGGEIVGITGRNGSGKTTLLKIIAGIIKPLRGRVRLYGKPIYVPEEPILYFTHPTPREELLSIGKPSIGVDGILKIFNIGGIMDRPIARLSTGERRRVALASALLRGYEVVLLDEPSGGLDNYSVEALKDLLLEISGRGDRCIVIATHDNRLSDVFTHKYVLEEGVLRRIY